MHVLMGLTWTPIVALPYIVLSPIAAVGPLLGAAGVLVVSLVPYRLMTRRCVLYDNRTLLVRGFWSSVTVHAADVTDIVLRHGDFISKAWAGHRVYVRLAAEDQALAVCVASCIGLRQTLREVEAFADQVSMRSTGDAISVREEPSSSRPDGAGSGALLMARLRGGTRPQRQSRR
jgi:hypothetical protein